MKMFKLFAITGSAFGIGALVATSCIGVEYPTVAFRCNPRQSDNCPDTHICCSDDPAAEDGELPAYTGKNIDGKTPIFSGLNNNLGTSGMCVRTVDIPTGSGLLDFGAENCPIPCNPTWQAGNVLAVCGQGRQCCQTAEITEADCVIDPSTNMYRPVRGTDIPALTNWSAGRHDTHQDPNGTGCTEFAAGMSTGAVWESCLRQLTVANQRGFCMQLGTDQFGQPLACPTARPEYADACDVLNGGGGPPLDTGVDTMDPTTTGTGTSG